MRRWDWFFALLAAALAALISGCSLAGDVTPPPGFILPTSLPTETITSEASFPTERPSAARGATIFAERCAPCHGVQGDGDGAQAAQLPSPPAALSDPLLARNASPAYWFDVVTNGRLENFMPPFAEGLSPAERWDVVHFLYTLSAAPEALEQGATLYQDNCARCHGPQGKATARTRPRRPPT